MVPYGRKQQLMVEVIVAAAVELATTQARHLTPMARQVLLAVLRLALLLAQEVAADITAGRVVPVVAALTGTTPERSTRVRAAAAE
jgi:hypothetical protein